ncbi:GNAT family N-acetyltransferase [Parenemella sanctibonifatiensis]|uniref:N-acetyltransferase domain-containing protein n=1 Tax=Parenemella sanctibonifatiensis TaxID=2016505 RepID=A0A255EI85_9ACTN|nr:GNAT family N-acetyltransferase [Parenemella sanctibonifatiensis]OYN91227.1 hypothetical protein CGZ91_07175 [Parenemella sanctibonifatiensis]
MERVEPLEALQALAGDDPWMRWVPTDPLVAYVHAGVAMILRTGRRRGFWIAPLRPGPVDFAEEAPRVRDAMTELAGSGLLEEYASESISAPQEHAQLAHETLPISDQGAGWEWMSTQSVPPAQPGEERIVELDDIRDAEEIDAFSRTHNPRAWAQAGTGVMDHWVGMRGPRGELQAVGGAEHENSGAPHLAGIVVAADLRGRGLGAAITAHLTRAAIAGAGVSTLGMYSDNAAARQLYQRLGYASNRAWHSRGLER